jgi:hypothetical protein
MQKTAVIGYRPPWSIQSGSFFLLLGFPFLFCLGVVVCALNSVLALIRTPRFWLDYIDFLNFWSGAKLTLAGHVTDLFDLRLFHAAQERLIGHALTSHPLLGAGHILLTDWLPSYNWSYPPHLLLWIMGLPAVSLGVCGLACGNVYFLRFGCRLGAAPTLATLGAIARGPR